MRERKEEMKWQQTVQSPNPEIILEILLLKSTFKRAETQGRANERNNKETILWKSISSLCSTISPPLFCPSQEIMDHMMSGVT